MDWSVLERLTGVLEGVRGQSIVQVISHDESRKGLLYRACYEMRGSRRGCSRV